MPIKEIRIFFQPFYSCVSCWDCVVHDEWQIKITELKNSNFTFLVMILFILVGCTLFQSTPIRVEHISKNVRFLGGMADLEVLASCLCLSFVCVCKYNVYFYPIKMYTLPNWCSKHAQFQWFLQICKFNMRCHCWIWNYGHWKYFSQLTWWASSLFSNYMYTIKITVSCRELLKRVQTSLKLISYLPKMAFLYPSMM